MTPPLFLVADVPDSGRLVLDGEEGRHAARVRRIGMGEGVLIGDGRGAVGECLVVGAGPTSLTLDVSSRTFVPESDPRITVLQAPAKGERAELAVELLTEVGVDTVLAWTAARCVVRWDAARADRALERWRRTAREAAKQSRRAWVPVVPDPADTLVAVARVAAASCALVLHEQAELAVSEVPLPTTGEVVLVVGPEGGIEDGELAAFSDVGARAVRLGPNVLRASTAGAAAVSALSARLGRW